MKDLSNFSEHDVIYDGYLYPTVEHAFQALKYSCTSRPELVGIVREAFANKTAAEAKSSGGKGAMKKWKVELDIRCWEQKKVAVMNDLIASKIERHPEIRQIIDTAKTHNMELVHFSRSDMYWGAHVNPEGTAIKDGKNMLGKLYMSYYNKPMLGELHIQQNLRPQTPPLNIEHAIIREKLVPLKEITKSNVVYRRDLKADASLNTLVPLEVPLKECPTDKILNPKTNRCVNKTSKLGKTILQEPSTTTTTKNKTRKVSSKKSTECPPDKIINPATKRCVNKMGKIGKLLTK
jgi:ribA/ribD-fused uncharacterized protein